MTTYSTRMPEFQAFKQRLEHWALGQLESTNRPYVETFKRRMTETANDVPKVTSETEPLLSGPTTWHQLLTALLDVELYTDRCTRLPWYLGFPPSTPSAVPGEPGAWLLHNVDAWFVTVYALLERIHTLTSLTCRHVIRPKTASWKIVDAQFAADIKQVQKVIDHRHRVAHGGGIIEVLAPGKAWEPYLLRKQAPHPPDTADIIALYYELIIRLKAQRLSQVQDSTIWILAFSETCFHKLRAEAFP